MRVQVSIIALALTLACAESTQTLPDASVPCGPTVQCAGPVEPPVTTYAAGLYCRDDDWGIPGPEGYFAAKTGECARAAISMSAGRHRHPFDMVVANCCTEPRFLRVAVPGTVATTSVGAIIFPDHNTQPRIATYALEGAGQAVTPACRGDEMVCTASTACAGIWTLEVPAGHAVSLGYLVAEDEALEVPDGFLPERLVAYIPRLEVSPDATPTQPASAALCSEDSRFGCYQCSEFKRPVRVEVDLARTPGVPEIMLEAFTHTAD